MRAPRAARLCAAIGIILCCSSAFSAPGDTTLVSRSQFQSSSANDAVLALSTSSDGRFIAFASRADNLVSNDTNAVADVFVYDRQTDTTERVSVSSGGTQANGASEEFTPRMSGDGRYVAFKSQASNLVANDTNGVQDIFVHDRQTHTTSRVSVDSTGAQANALSMDPAMSADGRFVAFASFATNLVAGVNSGIGNVYLLDRQTGITTLVNVGTSSQPFDGGAAEPSVSADGRYIAFTANAPNSGGPSAFQQVFVRDRQSNTTEQISVSVNSNLLDRSSGRPILTPDGRFVAFLSESSNLVPGPTLEGVTHVYVHDRQTHQTQRIDQTPAGVEADERVLDHSISADGRYVVFSSQATNLLPGGTHNNSNVYRRDRATGALTLQSADPANIISTIQNYAAFISANGRYIGYVSNHGFQGNVLPSDLLIRDVQAATTNAAKIAKVPSDSAFGASSLITDRAVSHSGRFVTFVSSATNLVTNPTNGYLNAFVRDRQTNQNYIVSVGVDGSPASGNSYESSISLNGRYIAFISDASNLVANDTNEQTDVFVRDIQTGTTKRVSVKAGGAQAAGITGHARISATGRYISFTANGDLMNVGAVQDNIYVYDMNTNTIELVSRGPANQLGDDRMDYSSISSDGRYVVFESYARNFFSDPSSISPPDIILRDRQTGTSKRLNVAPDGSRAGGALRPVISSDGRFVGFLSLASNLTGEPYTSAQHAFVRDLSTGKTKLVSTDNLGNPGNDATTGMSFSANGRYIALGSLATNLANDSNDQPDIFVHDQSSGSMVMVSISSTREQAAQGALAGSISGDGNFVAFTSSSSNLVTKDRNKQMDVFINERRTPVLMRINVGGSGYTDSKGHFWEADRGYSTGSISTYTSPIANTTDDVLYQTERWDPPTSPDLRYTFNVPNGHYYARLHFAENYARYFGIGKRVFDIEIPDWFTVTPIDIYREAGAHTAYVVPLLYQVENGELTFILRHRVQNPMIDAIEIFGE